MNEWFQQLAPRERLLVLLAAALAAVALVVMLGIRPVMVRKDSTRARIHDQQALLEQLNRIAESGGPGPAAPIGGQSGGRQSLVVLVDRTTRNHGLGPFLKRNQPDGIDKIRLRFENAPFDTLVEWLAALHNQYRLVTLSASIDGGRDPGRVNCSLVLARAGT